MHVSIRIKGHLDQSWQEWLEDLQIVHEEDGTSQLSGTLPDQSAHDARAHEAGSLESDATLS